MQSGGAAPPDHLKVMGLRRQQSYERDQMAKLYLADATSQQVADVFHTDKGTVCRHLEKAGVVRRTNGETKRKYFIRQDAFAAVQDEATAYWLGFLFADGCVYERRNGGNKGLNVILQEQDRSHVQKLATFLGGDVPIKKEKRYATWGIYQGPRKTPSFSYADIRSLGAVDMNVSYMIYHVHG